VALDRLPTNRKEAKPVMRMVNGMDFRSHSGYAYGIKRNHREIPVQRMFEALSFRPLLRKSVPQ
jgi:hypothetical protein